MRDSLLLHGDGEFFKLTDYDDDDGASIRAWRVTSLGRTCGGVTQPTNTKVMFK